MIFLLCATLSGIGNCLPPIALVLKTYIAKFVMPIRRVELDVLAKPTSRDLFI
jgi:hypothetical protein